MTVSEIVLNSPELLGEIFLSCLPEPKDDDDLPGRLPYEAPVILTHVKRGGVMWLWLTVDNGVDSVCVSGEARSRSMTASKSLVPFFASG